MMRSRTLGVHPLGLVNRKDSLSLDGFEGSGGDFPERYKPYLHDANTIVTSQHKSLSMFSLENGEKASQDTLI